MPIKELKTFVLICDGCKKEQTITSIDHWTSSFDGSVHLRELPDGWKESYNGKSEQAVNCSSCIDKSKQK